MKQEDGYDEFVVSLILALVFCAIILIGIIIVNIHKLYQLEHTENVVLPVQVPTFQRGDCFEGTWEKESWENLSTPDGIIERVGRQDYLILFRHAAEKRGGEKSASQLPISTFDRNHIRVACPTEWVQHTHKR